MKFNEIFDKEGLYVADGFADGVCFKVDDTLSLMVVTYKSKDDLFPEIEPTLMFKSLLTKEYRKVLTVGSLFKNSNKK